MPRIKPASLQENTMNTIRSRRALLAGAPAVAAAALAIGGIANTVAIAMSKGSSEPR
jgi:hypothetical protein